MLNDIPEELTDVEDLLFKRLFSMHVAGALCWFKELEAAKQLILKPIANGQHPEMLRKFNDALKFLTQMKDFGVAQINVDEYHKSFHSVCLMHMDREMAKEQLAEMEPMDREMVNDQLSIMAAKDMYMIEQQLEEMEKYLLRHKP
ncbi:hypothetical protein TSUD_226970 [Trifolium subterraneum]|uniref:Uncharacterized protein n=1 Tax=Trifolium subterraneum TaxID=3900 RepID=A0A2Z6MA30_TRISU|nr:hypothetical protein TSUD_226970 [Trifolium subterraneum]